MLNASEQILGREDRCLVLKNTQVMFSVRGKIISSGSGLHGLGAALRVIIAWGALVQVLTWSDAERHPNTKMNFVHIMVCSALMSFHYSVVGHS